MHFLLIKFIHLGSKGRLALSRYWTSVDRECMFSGESGGSFELTATYASRNTLFPIQPR